MRTTLNEVIKTVDISDGSAVSVKSLFKLGDAIVRANIKNIIYCIRTGEIV